MQYLLAHEEGVSCEPVCAESGLQVHLSLQGDHHGEVLPPVPDHHAVRQSYHLALRKKKKKKNGNKSKNGNKNTEEYRR